MIIPGNDPPQGANALPAAVRIRPMRLEDIDAVIQIDRLSFSLPWPASAFRHELVENPTSLLWVAEVDSPEGGRCVVGAVVVWMILDEAHIATLAVHPDYRRRGISRQLLVTVLRQAIERGATWLPWRYGRTTWQPRRSISSSSLKSWGGDPAITRTTSRML